MSVFALQENAKKAMEQLSYLSNEELDDVLNNDERLLEIIGNMENSYLKSLEDEKEQIIEQSKSFAEVNLSKEPELVEGREKLKSLYDEVERLSKVIDERTAELREKGGDISLETALALLQTSASEMEEESDQCVKKFLDNDMELDSFLDEFQTKRKLMHTRLVKADKLSKILQRGDPSIGLGMPNYINAPPVNINRGFFPGVISPGSPTVGGLPYPTGPLNMPLPLGMNFSPNHY